MAQAFEAAVVRRDDASGEDFNIVAPSALNVRGYAQIAASWFSSDKARTMLGYAPQYEAEDAVLESARWLVDHKSDGL